MDGIERTTTNQAEIVRELAWLIFMLNEEPTFEEHLRIQWEPLSDFPQVTRLMWVQAWNFAQYIQCECCYTLNRLEAQNLGTLR